MDLAEFEQNYINEITEEFLKRLNVIRYPELTDEKIDNLISNNEELYGNILMEMFNERGLSD